MFAPLSFPRRRESRVRLLVLLDARLRGHDDKKLSECLTKDSQGALDLPPLRKAQSSREYHKVLYYLLVLVFLVLFVVWVLFPLASCVSVIRPPA